MLYCEEVPIVNGILTASISCASEIQIPLVFGVSNSITWLKNRTWQLIPFSLGLCDLCQNAFSCFALRIKELLDVKEFEVKILEHA